MQIETRVSSARVLKIDISGVPQMWIGVEEAARYYATESVAYTLGDDCVRLHGGVSRMTGTRSTLDIHPIIAVQGTSMADRLLRTAPRLTRFNHKLFRRDCNLCAYCGDEFPDSGLEREHILPICRGGTDQWMNVVAACRACNQRKANRTPEEANMPLLYLPYTPSRWEDLILQARMGHIQGDQMAFLKAGLPASSRLHVS
ncbi:MAG: HNH endonuclease [Burkholderiaceae bacterium]